MVEANIDSSRGRLAISMGSEMVRLTGYFSALLPDVEGGINFRGTCARTYVVVEMKWTKSLPLSRSPTGYAGHVVMIVNIMRCLVLKSREVGAAAVSRKVVAS